MATIWIIHRDARGRRALARMLARAGELVVGSPDDDLLPSAGIPEAVVLGLSGDFERELEFVHRVAPRLECGWVLITEPGCRDEARRLFDTLPAHTLLYPPTPRSLRAAVRTVVQTRGADPLSRRSRRDRLAARFAHWFSDLELPGLLRSLDPRRAHVPLVVEGEPGTGRELLVRYVHAFAAPASGAGQGPLIRVQCTSLEDPAQLLEQIAGADDAQPGPVSIWLDEIDLAAPMLQARIRGWIEFGLPEGVLRAPLGRWLATAGDDDGTRDRTLDPRLEDVLSGITIRVPPLRERPDLIENLVADTARRWCAEHGEAPRHFGADCLEVLRDHPWPGNLAELEAVLERTLAGTSADPVGADALRFDGDLYSDTHPGASAAQPTMARSASGPLSGPGRPGAAAERKSEPAARVAGVTTPEPGSDSRAAHGEDDPTLQRLVGAIAHEVRNPLVSIRSFASLLPEHYGDPEFRERFAEIVGSDVRRIERVVDQLQELSEASTADTTPAVGTAPLPEARPVDVASLLEDLLDARRDTIRARNLLVLRELDRQHPHALGEESALRSALASILDRALELVPDRGDVYVASRHAGPESGASTLRLLLRCERGTAAIEGVSTAESALDFAVAEAAIRRLGGSLTVNANGGTESVIVVDLPAPEPDSSP